MNSFLKSAFLIVAFQLFSQNIHAQITVNDTGDGSDFNPGDGVCETGSGNGICTLRAAVEEANALTGADLLQFEATLDGATITIDAALIITSGNGDATTITGDIDGDNIPDITIEPSGGGYSGLVVESANSIISYLHIQGFSGAGLAAILVDGAGATDNEFYGNYLGTDNTGNAAGSASHSGIYLNNGATGTLIGDGTTTGANVIGGNTFGIRIANSSNNAIITANYIGIGIDGSSAIANVRGIDIFNSSGTQVGQTGLLSNVISSNSGDAIQLNGASGTTIVNNLIGSDETGLLDRGNANGIYVSNGSATAGIGDGTAAGRNVIVANNGFGIEVEDSDNATILGNYLGIGADGSTSLGNGNSGPYNIEISGTSVNTQIGDGTAGGRNIISEGAGAGSGGIRISAEGPTFVYGNYIGTDATGTLNRGNGNAGISLTGGSGQIGGTTTGQGNVISGNSYGIGVSVGGYDILGNYIGTDATGTSLIPNTDHGIRLSIGTGTNIGDGTVAGVNFISGNITGGILIEGASTTGNTIHMNYIGLQSDGISALGNLGNGILIENDANGNTLTENVIAHNGDNGVEIGEVGFTGIVNNALSQNSIYSNTNSGILITNSAQGGITTPVITSTLNGFIEGTSDAGATIEIFADASDEGEQYLDFTTADGSGNWSHQITVSSINSGLDNITATQTNGSNTSEFGSPQPLEVAFITTWQTDNAGTSNTDQITIPTNGTGYSYDIYWEEVGNPGNNGTEPIGQTGDYTITFPGAGTYQVGITGDFPRIHFNHGGDADKILTVEQWGNISWESMYQAFAGCSNLTIPATDAPDLSLVTDLREMFNDASFFNNPIDHWDVSSAQRMFQMFRNASSFNQDLNSWDLTNVFEIDFMFQGATAFNGAIGSWNISGVTSLNSVFQNASSFNQNIDGWDVSNVTNFSNTFNGASSFNQGLNTWNMSNAISIFNMFRDATNFNGNISSWTFVNLTSLTACFQGASSFNQDISGWNVGMVSSMNGLFSGATSFNQDISSWDVSSATNLSLMFNNASAFDQDLGGWDVSLVTNMSSMFNNSGLSKSNYDATLIGWESLPSLQTGVTLGATGLEYCDATIARANIISNYSWSISGDIENCPPSIQASDIIIESPFSSAIDIFWTNGNGANRIVVVHAGAAVDSDPVDNTTYTANTVFGSGSQIGVGNYVVYNGNGNTVRVTGISSSTNYHVRVYEYDGTAGAEIYNINTATGNPAESLINGINSCNYNALVALYNATDGPNWSNNTGWLTATPVTDWYGINTSSGRVTSVSLDGNNLVGTLPAEIGCLNAAQTFSLSDNQISGTIPPEIGNLTGSFYIRLRGNQLSGSIPPELGNLRTIQLWLQDNDLTGSIPIELGNINQLRELRLDQNQLTGTIPTELGVLPNLRLLFLYNNQLTGTIPITASNFPSLQGFDINNNLMTGTIPADLGHPNHIAIDYLLLGNNQFTGTIPSELGDLTNLNYLQLHSNQLTGSIPSSLNNLPNLIQLYLDNNQLTGAIPVFDNLTSLQRMRLDNNQLTGGIPAEFGSLFMLIQLELDVNQLTGSVPIELGNLTNLVELRFDENQLDGTLPTELGNLTNLQYFEFNDNAFTGDIPSSFSNLVNLQYFRTQQNGFINLPDLSALVNLVDCGLQNNAFEFDDLEPNIGLGGIAYSPQANLIGPGDQSLAEGGMLDVTIPVGGTQNQYQWYKDGNPLTGQTTDNLLVSGLTTSDAGTYHLEVTSTAVSGLTLISDSFVITVAPTAPEIEVYVGADNTGVAITDGQVTTIDLGTALVGNDLDQQFAIENTGDSDLNISDITVSGTDFSVISSLTTVAAGATANFTVRLSGATIGSFNATVTISSNDTDESVFDFPVTGTISSTAVPEIEVFAGMDNTGTAIVDGQGTAIDFGSANEGTDITQTFAIENTGTADLSITGINVSGSAFSISGAPSMVTAGATATFDVTLSGATVGAFNETITINNDDSNEAVFDFPITGTINAILEPEIEVYHGVDNTGSLIVDDQTTAIDFGSTDEGNDITQIFAIENIGTADLVISDISVSGSVYTISGAPTSIAMGVTATFDITLSAATIGTFNETVTINSNDADEAVFIFSITGEVFGVNIIDNNTGNVIISNQDIDVGITSLNVDIDRSFVVENLSTTEELSILSITVDNPVFIVIDAPSSISPQGTAQFTVRLIANEVGAYSGTVSVSTNINNFSFGVTGEVISDGPPPLNIFNIVTPNNDLIHDYFKIANIREYPDNVVNIFNRWGVRVFQMSGYNNLDKAFVGISDSGKELDTGNYYYVIDKGNGDKVVTGYLLLKR